MGLQIFDSHVFADEVALIFADDVFGEDGELGEIAPEAKVATAEADLAEEISIVRNFAFGVREKSTQITELLQANFFSGGERSGFDFFQNVECVAFAQAIGQR